MIQAANYQEHHSRILEAEILLVARAAKTVYQKIGGGLTEDIYRQALQKEFAKKRIKYQKTRPQTAADSEQIFHPEFLYFGNLVLYSKAAAEIIEQDRRDVKLCLQKLNIPAGLIVNFGREGISLERISR